MTIEEYAMLHGISFEEAERSMNEEKEPEPVEESPKKRKKVKSDGE